MTHCFSGPTKIFLASILVIVAAHVYAADYVEGDVLVRFRPTQTLEGAHRIAAAHGGELQRHFKTLSEHEGRVIGLLHSTKTTAALLEELRTDPDVEFAEPNYLRYFTDMRPPNDTFFTNLWAMQNTGQTVNGDTGTAGDDISFRKAWGLARPSTNEVVVGIIDSGLDITHPDIAPNLWTNPGENPNNNLDDDGNGYTNDIHGFDFILRTGNLTDSGFHGTHVTGTIAAVGNNNLGVIGVDFQAHVMMLKASTDGSSISSAAEIEAIQYATMMKGRGVNIVALNASFGGGSFSSTEQSAIQAAGTAGIIFCAAAGNNTANNDTTLFYPASYRLSNEIVVAATDENDALASFSNFGATTVDLGAPGVDIYSLLPLNQSPASTSSVVQGANTYQANMISFSGATNSITRTIYRCGIGNPADFPLAVSNNIALIERGTLTFSNKVINAMHAHAAAAIIFNNAAGNFLGTLASGFTNWIPAVSIAQADGQALTNIAPVTGTVTNIPDPTVAYQYLAGTSMATPHVAAAVAFAAMNFPTETVTQRIHRILTNATPVTGLSGKVVTGARLNLARMVDTDTNGLPDWWELQYFNQLTGVSPTADPDNDHENNLAEFLAGTVPTNSASVLALNTTRFVTNSFRFQWPSVSGRYYRVLRSTNVLAGFNTIVQTNIAATPPINLFTDTPPATLDKAFYRLQLEP